MTKHRFIVWCNDGSDCVFNVAVCKTKKEADATRGFYSATQPNKRFSITKETI